MPVRLAGEAVIVVLIGNPFPLLSLSVTWLAGGAMAIDSSGLESRFVLLIIPVPVVAGDFAFALCAGSPELLIR